jgi:hypothetical protein
MIDTFVLVEENNSKLCDFGILKRMGECATCNN